MFVWKLKAIRQALEEFLPDSRHKFEKLARSAASGGGLPALLAETYPTLQRISIDFAVMEKARKVLMVDLNCEWLDVGSWTALEDVSELDGSGNIVLAANSLLLDCLRNIIVSEDDHLLAVLGMEDCIVVHSPDATLVCSKTAAQRLKELITRIKENFGDKYA